MNYLTPQQITGLTSTANPFIPITYNQEQEFFDNQIKNQINTYIDGDNGGYLGPLSLGTPSFRVEQGEVENVTDQQLWNRGVVDKLNSWIGGLTGRAPIHIDMAHYGLKGKITEGWGSYIPFNPYPWEEVEKARERYDDNFISNKNQEMSKAIIARYGENKAPLIEKLLEQNYGDEWKKTFAVGTKNQEAFLEQVNRVLLNESNKTSYFSERRSELDGIKDSWGAWLGREAQISFIRDYDTVRDVAITMGLEAVLGGAPALLKTGLRVGTGWALRLPKTLLDGTKLGGRLFTKLEPMFARQEAILSRSGNIFEGILKDFSLQRRPLVRNIARLENFMKQGGIVVDTPQEALRANKLLAAQNPFSPVSQPRRWMQWNSLNIRNSAGVIAREGLMRTSSNQLLNNIALKLDDIINIGHASTLSQWVWKFARTGAIFGAAEGAANSVWMQDDAADQALLMENIDIPRFNLGQTLADTAIMGSMGFVFGGVLGVAFSPVLATKAAIRLIDGTDTLGTNAPQRGLLQLIGNGRVTPEEWENASKLRNLLGVQGHQALQIAKTAKLEQIRLLLKHITGDDRTSNFYLDPKWLAENDISEHEVGSLVSTILEVLSRSSPEYSVNPLSHEMLSEILVGFAQAKKAAKEAGTPLPTALDADVIAGTELRELMQRHGLLMPEPNEPVQVTGRTTSDLELARAREQLNNKIKNKEITLEEAERQSKLLDRAEKKNKFIKERTKELEEARKAKALLEEQYPNPEERSDEIKSLLENYNKVIDNNERYIKYVTRQKTNHVNVTVTPEGSLERVRISGYDISNTQAGFLLTKYLSALKRFNEAANIPDMNTRRLAREKLRAEIDAIETEMDSRFKLNQEGKTREELRINWGNEKWNQLKNNPIMLAKFEEAFSSLLGSQRLTAAQRAVAMNWYSEIRLRTGLGSIYNKIATWGSGTTEAMYQVSDLVYEAFRLVDDGQFFAYSDLANPYQTFSIREAIENGIRRAVGVNDTVARIKKKFPEQQRMIQQRVIQAKRMGKEQIDPTGLSKEMVEEGNLLLNKIRDFYEYSANKGKELGKPYTDAFTYFPQMLSRKLDPQEVERLAALGYQAMRTKLKETRQLSFAELERLGLIERDEDGNIVNIPENSLFYLVDEKGNPLPLEQMIDKMPKTVEELRAFEAKRRLESDKAATLPPDLQEVLNSPIRMSTITEAEKKKTIDTLKSIITKLLERSEAVLGGEYDLVRAGQHILTLKQRATEFGDKEALKWINDTLNELKEKRGIEINENPENPTTTILNSMDSVKPEDKPTLKTIHVGAPEVTLTKPIVAKKPQEPTQPTTAATTEPTTKPETITPDTKPQKTVIFPGSVFKKWVPENEAARTTTLPALSFTSRISEEALGSSPFSKEAQELGHHYTQAVVAKKIASKFGEEEPTTYLQTIKFEDLEDSLITMEHILAWVDDPEFVSQVDGLHKLTNGKYTKTDIGMYLIGGYAARAKEYNLHQLKGLTDTQLAKVQREFHNINYLTLRGRYEGTPVKAINPVELLDNIFGGVSNGKKLWTPSVETKPIQKVEIPTLTPEQQESAASFKQWWQERQKKGKTKRSIERRVERLEEALKKLDEVDNDISAKEINPKTGKPYKKKFKLTKEQQEWYKQIQEVRRAALVKLLSTKEKPVSFTKETKKQAKRKIASLRKQLEEVFGDEPTLPTKEGRKFIAGENEGTRIKINSILNKLSEDELFALYHYYNHKAPGIVELGGTKTMVAGAWDKVDPVLGFLFTSIDEKANIARSLGKLDELGIEPSHFLSDGSLSAEGKLAYLKKLIESNEVQEIVKRVKKAQTNSKASKKISREVQETLAKEYWIERGKLLDKQAAIRDAYPLYVEDLKALHVRRISLIETLETFDQLQKGLLDFEDVLLKIDESNQNLNTRFNSLNKKINEVNEVITKLKEENKLQKQYDETGDSVERKNNLIKELEYYVLNLEKERDGIQLQLKPIKEKELSGYKIEDVKELRENIQKEIKEIEEQIKLKENNDPMVIVERALDQLDLNSKYDGIVKVDRGATRLRLIKEVQRQLEIKRQKLADLKTMDLGQYNQTIVELINEINNISATIDKLQKAGVTPNRRNYINRLEYLLTQIAEIEQSIADLYKNPQFSLVDPTLGNFSSMYEWMKNVVNTFEERTMSVQDLLKRLAEKPDEPAFMNFDASRRTLDDFANDKTIIYDGMELGLLFYRIDIPMREGQQKPKSRLLLVDLNRDKFEPVDITGDVQQAKQIIQHRIAHNLENPNSQITLQSILNKREQLTFEDPNLLKLNKQINRMLKATQKWVNQRNTWLDMVRSPEMLPTEFVELAIKEQAIKAVNAFNILPAQSELAKSKFNELFDALKSLVDSAKQGRLTELEKQKQNLQTTFTRFYEASKEQQVPVFNKERIEVIKELLAQKKELEDRLKEYGNKLKTPTLKQKAEGYSLGDFEIQNLHEDITDLTFALFDLAEGKNISASLVAKTNFKKISEKTLRDFAQSRNLTLKEAKEVLKVFDKEVKDLTLLDRIDKIKGTKPIIKSERGYQINHRFTVTDMLRVFTEGGDQAEALRQIIVNSARRRALAIAGKVGGVNKKITEEAVNDALDDIVLLMYHYVQARNNPELLGSLDTVRTKISDLNEELKTANDFRISEIEEELRHYRDIERSLRMPDTFRKQSYAVVNKDGNINGIVRGERVYFRSIPGENYPDTNLTLRGLVNRVANSTMETVRTKKSGVSSRPISLDEINDVMDLETGNLTRFIDPSEVRGRGLNSDYLRPDDILSREEGLSTVMEFLKNRETFIDEAPSVLRRALNNNNISITIYRPFVDTVTEVIEEDLKRISSGLDPLYLTKGEKDRVTQRVNVGIIKNEYQFFEAIASTLRSKYHHFREGRTNKFNFRLDNGIYESIEINSDLIKRAFKQFKKELRIVKDETLADVIRLDRKLQKAKTEAEGVIAKADAQTDPYYKIRLYDTRAELRMYLAKEEIIDLVLKLKTLDPEEEVNLNNWKTARSINTGERIGGKTQISLADLRARIISGKITESKLWNDYRIALSKAEEGIEPTLIGEQEQPKVKANIIRDFVSKQGTTSIQDYADQISLQLYEEKYLAKLIEVTDKLTDPELVIKWGLTEITELRQKLNQARLGKASERNRELDLALTTRELTTLIDFVETFARKNSITIDENFETLYRQALVDSGFSGKVRKAVNPDLLMSQALESVGRHSPLSDIVTSFNQSDMWKEFEVLSYILSKGSPKELLEVLPQSSLLNIIDELEEFGLITLLVDNKDILVTKLINNEPLNNLLSITHNGLEVLKTTRHASNRRGYFGGRDIRMGAELLQSVSQVEEEKWALRMGMAADPETYNSLSTNLQRKISNNGIEEFMVLSFRKELVEKQLKILGKSQADGLGITSMLMSNSYEERNNGQLLLKALQNKEDLLIQELNEIKTKLSDLMGTSKNLDKPTIKKLPAKKVMNQAIEKPKPLSSKPWLGSSDTMSIADKYLEGLDGNTRNYVGRWSTSGTTGLQDDMRAWAYGMNNQPYTKPTTYTRSSLEKKRPLPYQGTGKPSFTNEDLLLPENAELASMLSDDVGDITMRYAKTSLARNEADLALRNRIKQNYGIDLPEGYGWGDWIDMLRNMVAKWDTSAPVGKDGKKLDRSVIDHIKELIDNLNHYVNQNTGREIPSSQLPKDAKRLLRMSKNLTLGLLGPSFGLSVVLGELPFGLLRKNGSLRAFLKGLEELFNIGDVTEKELNNTIFAFEKAERGFQSKFGGDGVSNDETGYIKRLTQYFKNMFNPNPEELSSGGLARAMDYVDNFLAQKAALSMEFGGMSSFVSKVLSIAYEKEKVNLFGVKDKLLMWVKKFDTPRFKELAQLANSGDIDAQKELVKLFKAASRESGVPLPIASYLWMAKISNEDEVSRLVRILELGTDNEGSFDMRSIDKAIYESGFGSVSNKINKELDQATFSKLAYYLELQARNASPEPFGTGSVAFKYNKGTLSSILTFLMSYPIASYQTYILRNGTTHAAAAMLGISLGVIGMEILAKRLRDIISGKKRMDEPFEEYKKSPLAFFLRDLSYAQMGGNLDQALNPLYIAMGKSLVNDGVKTKPQDFPNFVPLVGDTPALTALNSVIRQGYQAVNGALKGDPSQLVDAAGNLATEGIIGKGPTAIMKNLYNLSQATKANIWKQVYAEYGNIDTKNESKMHELIKDTLIQNDIMENYAFDPLKLEKQLPKTMERPMLPKVPKVDIQSQVQSTTPTTKVQSKTKSSSSPITPNIINALVNEKGVSPLLVDELIKSMNK